MTAMYRTSITATFQIEVEAESRDEAERIVDGVLDSNPLIALFEVTSYARKNVEAGVWNVPADDVLMSAEIEDEPAVLVRGSMHRSPAQ